MKDLAEQLYKLAREYEELAEIIPMDYPGSRLLPRLNKDLTNIAIKMLIASDGKASNAALSSVISGAITKTKQHGS